MPLSTWKDKCIKLVDEGDVVTGVYDGNLFHVCKYCGKVALGQNQNILCRDCKQLFGHTYFSEL